MNGKHLPKIPKGSITIPLEDLRRTQGKTHTMSTILMKNCLTNIKRELILSYILFHAPHQEYFMCVCFNNHLIKAAKRLETTL